MKIIVFLLALFLFVGVFRRIIFMGLLWLIGKAIKRELEKNNQDFSTKTDPVRRKSSNRYGRDDQGEYVDYEEVK